MANTHVNSIQVHGKNLWLQVSQFSPVVYLSRGYQSLGRVEEASLLVWNSNIRVLVRKNPHFHIIRSGIFSPPTHKKKKKRTHFWTDKIDVKFTLIISSLSHFKSVVSVLSHYVRDRNNFSKLFLDLYRGCVHFTQCLSARLVWCSRNLLAVSGRIFHCYNLRGAAKDPTMHRNAPHNGINSPKCRWCLGWEIELKVGVSFLCHVQNDFLVKT